MSTGEDISSDSVGVRLYDPTEKADKPHKTDDGAPYPENWIISLTWDDIHTGDCTMLAPQVSIYAGVAIVLTVLAVNVIGERVAQSEGLQT